MKVTSPALRLPPALRAARGGLTGRRVQTVVISLVVLAATAACTLALGMLVDSNAPFDHAFASQHGAQVTATVAHEGAEHELYESWVFGEVEKGVKLPGLYPPNDEAKARYAAWRKTRQ